MEKNKFIVNFLLKEVILKYLFCYILSVITLSVLKLLGRMIYLAVSWYTFVHFILHIHLIFHLCVPRLEFLEPKWSQTFITNMIIIYIVRYTYFFNLSNIILTIVIVDCNLLQSQNSHFLNMWYILPKIL